jgi:hypothetical protein
MMNGLNDIIYLPVSFGEAFDKLSILDIKLNKIKDERKNEVQKEYDTIKEDLYKLMTKDILFHYKILKNINENIWEKQDIFRTIKDDAEKNRLCVDIIEENDRRFRVKNKINNILCSSLNEQKGYVRKKAFILTHLGLGDHITSMGIVRYYATKYDELHVVCKKKYEDNLRLFYKDDITIKIFPIDTRNIKDDDISSHFGFSKKSNATYIYNNEIYDLITTGMHGPINTKSYNIPFCFYQDVQLDFDIFWEYSHIIDTQEANDLYNLLIKNNVSDYILIHNSSSRGNAFLIEEIENKGNLDRNKILFINTERNVYLHGHPFYELANKFVMKPLVFYKNVIINASQIYVSDSCIFCLCLVLNIKTDKCYIINKGWGYEYIFTEQYKFNPQRTRKFYPF